MNLIELLKPTPPQDEGQRRMIESAQEMFADADVYAELHEYDAACQEERKRV